MSDDPKGSDRTQLPSTEDTAPPKGQRRSIGPYSLLQRIGEGGMGEVWLAEQTEPVRRRVAVKVIKQGMDTKHVVARFEAERQALAMMDHSCVAKVFDAGTTPEGRPYFVMEYVKGVPIAEYCDRHRLTIRERLQLFRSVCEGVQHAHQKAIIHRDLKPSNILVAEQDGQRLPKIIDFGLAKAMAQKLTERTMFTELGVLVGTPEYMSPEQAHLTGEDVDTRTDVYSLGVILYQLMVGALPFDPEELRGRGFEGIRRMIREEEPRRPSTRFAALGDQSAESAKMRRSDSVTLLRQLRGDVDWITMRALEKDPARRYGSAADFSADIARYLSDEPVQARPPSTAYRTRKFILRHRLGVTAGAVVALALVAGVIGIALGLVRARRAEAVARAEQERSERIATFLANTLSEVDPVAMGRTLSQNLRDQEPHGDRATLGSAREAAMVDVARHLVDEDILRKTVRRVDAELKAEPALAASLCHTIGLAYRALQLYGPAADLLERSVALYVTTHGPDNKATILAKSDLAGVYRRGGRFAEAESLYVDAIASARRTLGPEAGETLLAMNFLGDTYRFEGRVDEAGSLLRETLRKMRRVLGDEDMATLTTANNLALVLRDQHRYPEAETLFRDTAERMARVYGPDDRETINTNTNLAGVLRMEGRLPEAEKLLLEVLDASRRVVGDEGYLTLAIYRNLAEVYSAQGRLEEAEALDRLNIGRLLRILGASHPVTCATMRHLAIVLMARHRTGEAEPLLVQALAGDKRSLGERHPTTLSLSNDLAAVYERLGRRAEAEQTYLGTTREFGKGRRSAPDSVYAEAAFHLACLSASRGDRSGAMEWLERYAQTGLAAPRRILGATELRSLRGPDLDALVARAPGPKLGQRPAPQ